MFFPHKYLKKVIFTLKIWLFNLQSQKRSTFYFIYLFIFQQGFKGQFDLLFLNWLTRKTESLSELSKHLFGM